MATKSEKEREPTGSPNSSPPMTAPPDNPAPPYPPIPIIFVLFWIIFGIIFYVFVDLNQGSQTSPNGFENEINEINENVEFEFENVKCELENVYCGYDCNDVFNGPHCPTPYPPYPIIEFINSRVLLREQLVLKDIFGVNDNENGFEYGMYICFFGKK